ncbi:NAD-dependent protein deacylase SIR4 [Cladobotryum mycophilum]|uniref:NAD-dependent protein deacylase SIR4 n=1 Tax=Cladobotryum mycophilum TaxID=491253 RepID=A0ABR0SBH3_9HYPO
MSPPLLNTTLEHIVYERLNGVAMFAHYALLVLAVCFLICWALLHNGSLRSFDINEWTVFVLTTASLLFTIVQFAGVSLNQVSVYFAIIADVNLCCLLIVLIVVVSQGRSNRNDISSENQVLLNDAICGNELEADSQASDLGQTAQSYSYFNESIGGLKTNPDGDVDLPDAPYTTFRYPPCPRCLVDPPIQSKGYRHTVAADADGAWISPSTAGILKPAVVLFGASITDHVKTSAEKAIDSAGKLLVMGTSLATYSSWRLAKRAKEKGMPIAIVNIGGVRGEEQFFNDLNFNQTGEQAVRVEISTDHLLPALVSHLRQSLAPGFQRASVTGDAALKNSTVFKDLPS